MLWLLLILRRLVVRASAVGRIARMAHVVVAVEGALALAALSSAYFCTSYMRWLGARVPNDVSGSVCI